MLAWIFPALVLFPFSRTERDRIPIPAEKTNDLVDLLSDLRRDRRMLTPLLIKKAEKDIAAVKQVNLANGLMLQGMLDTIQLQKDKAIQSFERALNASGRDSMVLWNYGSSLLSLGLFEDAENLFLPLAEYPETRDMVSTELFRMGKYQLAGQISSAQHQDRDIPAAAARLGLKDEEVSRAVQIAGNNLVSSGHLISGARILVLSDRIVHYVLGAVDPATLASLEYDLAESFLDQGIEMDRLVVSFMGLPA